MADEPLYSSDEQKLALVERNLYLQSNRIAEIVLALGRSLRMTPDLIRELHRLALHDIYSCAGRLRSGAVRIIGSDHVPPAGSFVGGLVDDLCVRVNAHDPDDNELISTAAFLLWRLNWIHPFRGGNGRVSRAATHLFLCARLGFILPGQPTLASYIVQNKRRYIDALVDADTALKLSSVVDVRKMKAFLDDWFDKQLESVPPPSPW
jgi:Fic family protein